MWVVLAIVVAVSCRRFRGKMTDSVIAGVRMRLRDARVDRAVGKSGDKSLSGRNISRLSDYLAGFRQTDTEPAAQHPQRTDCIEIPAEGSKLFPALIKMSAAGMGQALTECAKLRPLLLQLLCGADRDQCSLLQSQLRCGMLKPVSQNAI